MCKSPPLPPTLQNKFLPKSESLQRDVNPVVLKPSGLNKNNYFSEKGFEMKTTENVTRVSKSYDPPTILDLMKVFEAELLEKQKHQECTCDKSVLQQSVNTEQKFAKIGSATNMEHKTEQTITDTEIASETSSEHSSSVSDKDVLIDSISRWKPRMTNIRAYKKDMEFEVDGWKKSGIVIAAREAMLTDWAQTDRCMAVEASDGGVAQAMKQASEESRSICRGSKEGVDMPAEVANDNYKQTFEVAEDIQLQQKMTEKRKEIVKAQIRDAKHFFKIFGVWVRKEWIVNKEESEMWEEAEKKLMLKEDKFGIDSYDGNHSKETLEELKERLKVRQADELDEKEVLILQRKIRKMERKVQKHSEIQQMSELERFRKSEAKLQNKSQSGPEPDCFNVSSAESEQRHSNFVTPMVTDVPLVVDSSWNSNDNDDGFML
ncbi:uncharacterized protein MONOS_535 [Monocercomonoides exilis]|uniref:uncharacterized protein n=1 Tax=Monocercomonoides exilis TaxID=2049356 RepID=UPI00355A4AD9|nr:hypothetical protein MONOS_535 [Monocercomonoides exilis]|eukprot:MONOS_535.1-p1 / transcript=MONOS_535.1 / gene=MONOS_535 / organism=Monocercomonoides_exilis_PA203 / gene_product=unspecified product / transcript_product=unspecified product / location=Mono_scaffold00008:208428-209785(+) / protein_length=433 / sequence_SO=supercontig / SO=protein_coding / is_pseudo=false